MHVIMCHSTMTSLTYLLRRRLPSLKQVCGLPLVLISRMYPSLDATQQTFLCLDFCFISTLLMVGMNWLEINIILTV